MVPGKLKWAELMPVFREGSECDLDLNSEHGDTQLFD